MNKKERALFIEKKLNELFPNPKAPLNHKNAFTFLIAVLLSAQTTDKRVNIVTKELFKAAGNPEDMFKLGGDKVYEFIKTCGLAPKKAKAIIETSKILLDKAQEKLDKSNIENKNIINQAKTESEKLIIEMNDKFHKSAEIKKNLAKKKITQMKELAIKEIKDTSVKITIDSVKKIISTSVDKSRLDNLFEKNLEEAKSALKKTSS